MYCRPALLAPPVGVVGTNRSSACVAGPPTADVNVGPFGLKGDDVRRTEPGERLPLGFDSSQRFTPSPTGASSVSASVSTNILCADMTGNAVLILVLILY